MSGSLTVVEFLYIYYRHLSTAFITKTGDVLKLYVRTADVAKKHEKAMQILSPLFVLTDGRGCKEIT